MEPTHWEKHDIEQRIVAILRDVQPYIKDHRFGRPFLTAYQLAIEFDRRHPEVRRALELQVGGTGIGEQTSLASYLSGQLARRINSGKLATVEGALLSDKALRSMTFRYGSQTIESSLAGYGMDMALFRYVGDV